MGNENFGMNMARIRKFWRFTMDEMAALIGLKCTRSTINGLENYGSYPHMSIMLRLEEITGIPIYILCRHEINTTQIPIQPIMSKYQPPLPDLSKVSDTTASAPTMPTTYPTTTPTQTSPTWQDEVKNLRMEIDLIKRQSYDTWNTVQQILMKLENR